ncbi:MAG: nucleotidyltransferase domain-containing protein [Muribaculaceae bacterium]|nr:nucleotidyltransferase domain-containing protein [Muribaculaceae bacterium]
MADKEIINILKEHIHQIHQEFEVTSLCVFGSAARGENGPESDVDIFVDMPAKIILVSRLKRFLEKILHKSVDLVRKHPHLSERFITQLKKDAVYVI